MNRIFLISSVILLCFHASNGRLSKQAEEVVYKNCANELKNISPEDKKKVEDHDTPETEAGKCYLSCGFHAIGCMKDGKIDLEGLKSRFEYDFKDNTIKGIMSKITLNCMEKENNFSQLNGCEAAYAFQQCLSANPEYIKVKTYLNSRE
ncbi:uncharacterized protein LOC142331224 [Lycorma delicatula]|uniref:uncharacterized protein LOC142331224 n=1 Tax=Lycorma delicatula TaxID=130591 RepID=UPI003F5136D0